MSEAAANSKEKNEIEVSKTILPENKKYESESLNYQIKIPDWLLNDINNLGFKARAIAIETLCLIPPLN